MFEFSPKDFIDILLVALMLYYVYRLMRESRSLNVFTGIMIFVLVWLFVSQILEMKLLGSIMDNLGGHRQIRTLRQMLSSASTVEKERREVKTAIVPIVMGCMNMSRQKVGALIVIERATPLDDIVATGETIDANINQRLLENLFFKNSPLHDGAVIISKLRVKAAGCILPVSHNLDIPKELGLRHRAALGITQESDAIAVVVSEETGGISAAIRGELRLRLSAEQLEGFLTQELE